MVFAFLFECLQYLVKEHNVWGNVWVCFLLLTIESLAYVNGGATDIMFYG
jgi:hypothetical protein